MKKNLIFSLILIFIMPLAINAAPSIYEQEEQREKARQEALEKKEREERSDVFLQESVKTSPKLELPQEEINFLIENIELEGKYTEKFNWLHKQLKVYAGNRIGLNGINLIMKQANNALIEKGFVTSKLMIKEQDLSEGTLIFSVVPGIINDILFDESSAGNWESAFPTRPGDILNLRDLEQGLEQLKRVPSQDADMQIIPGEKEGESNILITVKKTKSWRAVTSFDDSGSKATGKLQVSQTISIDNLFKSNDLFYFSLNSDAERKGSQYGTRGNSFYYSIPNGNDTYTFSYNSYDYHQRIFAGAEPLIYSGASKDLRVKAEKLLKRTQNSKTYLELGIISRNSKNFVEDTEIELQRKKTTAFTVALSHKKYIGNAVFDAKLNYKQGVPWFDAQNDPRNAGPTTRYHIWNLDLSFIKPVVIGKTKAQYRASFSSQFTNNRLLAIDCFNIGNRYTVRGFDGEEMFYGERGWYLQSEISLPLKNNTAIYLGLDYGQVNGPSSDYLNAKSLLGAVVGLRGALGERCHFDVFAGKPLKKPASCNTAKQTYGFNVMFEL